MWVTRAISALLPRLSQFMVLCTCEVNLFSLKTLFLPSQTMSMEEVRQYGNSCKGNPSSARRRYMWLAMKVQEIQATFIWKGQAKSLHVRTLEVCFICCLVLHVIKSRPHMGQNPEVVTVLQILFKPWLTIRCSPDKDKIFVFQIFWNVFH